MTTGIPIPLIAKEYTGEYHDQVIYNFEIISSNIRLREIIGFYANLHKCLYFMYNDLYDHSCCYFLIDGIQ